ncbi:hypothetical protein MUCCIDRAFT_107290 [Mucor lusitanicus CBS 277.49]|uniref:Uncharacterized protein n=1 Tax=Mucor lusitanicus CBS 277.49 TaxID=747725 RepID=A0A168NT70_MUCCL|nr:hypothetical protein MUCCIDRAFT_107290 [Mucor lusitanicus CBS 277.49]
MSSSSALLAGRRWAVLAVNRPLVLGSRAYTLIPSTPHPAAPAASTASVHETTTNSYRSLSDDNETTFGPTFNSVFDE